MEGAAGPREQSGGAHHQSRISTRTCNQFRHSAAGYRCRVLTCQLQAHLAFWLCVCSLQAKGARAANAVAVGGKGSKRTGEDLTVEGSSMRGLVCAQLRLITHSNACCCSVSFVFDGRSMTYMFSC